MVQFNKKKTLKKYLTKFIKIYYNINKQRILELAQIKSLNRLPREVTMKKILFLLLALCASSQGYSDITWSAPTAISTALTDASAQAVVIDNNNNATAVWVENNLIQASILLSGGSWSAPVTISNPVNTASTPKLEVDSSGNITAVWIENTQVVSATHPFGGSWSSISTISGTGAANISLAMTASGTAVAVWTRSNFVESSTRISGTWSLVSVLSATNSNNPHVAVSSFGTAMAVWHTISSGSDLIVTNTLTLSSNTWGATKNLFSASAAFSHNYPKIALDPNGNAVVAWFRYNFQSSAYQNVQVLTSSLTQGAAAWGIPTILSNAGIRNPADLTIKLKFDTSGNAIIVWINSYDGQVFTPESSRKLFGGTWALAVLPQLPTLYSFGIDLSLAAGTACLTSMAWDDISSIQIINQENDTTNPIQQGWTPINAFSTGNDNGYPKCALSATGSTLNAVSLWIHFDGTNNVIHAASGSDQIITPPSNVSASQSVTNFGVYSDYNNTITWTASSNPNLIQYDIYRNGVYFAATDTSTFSFVDHNATQGGTVIYGVAALTADLRQSPIINFTLNP